MTYTPELDTPQPAPDVAARETKIKKTRWQAAIILALLLAVIGAVCIITIGPAKHYSPSPLSPAAVKVAFLVKEHPEEWHDGLGGLHNETRGITIDYGTRMQDWNDIGDGTTLSVRVGSTTIPGIKADRENQFLRGVVDVQSADQQIIYEQLKRWHSETLESQVQQRAIDEATAIKKLMDEPA